jgi:hypothetical protein
MMVRDGIGNTAGKAKHNESTLVMDGHLGEKLSTTRSRACMHRVISLLEAAVGQLHDQEHTAEGTVLEAASLLRQQFDPPDAREVSDGRGRLLSWQVRKVRDYIDGHITGPILVADLCALLQAHVRGVTALFPRAPSRGTGRSIHAHDRCALE